MILNKISKPSKKAIPQYSYSYIEVIPVCDEQTGPHLRRWIIKSHNISKQINMTPLTRRYSLLEQTGPHLPIRLGPIGTGLVRGKEGTIIGKMG